MKKYIPNLFAIVSIGMITVFTSCKKTDTTAPVITLNGPSSQIISLQAPYTESGAKATDDKDGAITPTIYGTVNVHHTGTYSIIYRAVDATGNIASATRTVYVKNDLDAMAGTYQCVIAGSPTITYTQAITVSAIVNKRIHFSKFGNYLGNTSIYVNIANTIISLPRTASIQIGSPAIDHVFAGTGGTNSNGFILTYTDSTNSAPAPSRTETFTKQ